MEKILNDILDETFKNILNLEGHFFWSYSHEFFIKTDNINFIWSCPSYIGGTNTIKVADMSYKDWCLSHDIPEGRDDGIKKIGNYTSKEVIFT